MSSAVTTVAGRWIALPLSPVTGAPACRCASARLREKEDFPAGRGHYCCSSGPGVYGDGRETLAFERCRAARDARLGYLVVFDLTKQVRRASLSLPEHAGSPALRQDG